MGINCCRVDVAFVFCLGSNPTEKTLLGAAAFLHHELPIRFAKRAVELDNLPYGLSSISSIRTVKGWYIKSFDEVTRVSD